MAVSDVAGLLCVCGAGVGPWAARRQSARLLNYITELAN